MRHPTIAPGAHPHGTCVTYVLKSIPQPKGPNLKQTNIFDFLNDLENYAEELKAAVANEVAPDLEDETPTDYDCDCGDCNCDDEEVPDLQAFLKETITATIANMYMTGTDTKKDLDLAIVIEKLTASLVTMQDNGIH